MNIVYVLVENTITKIKQGVTKHCLKDALNVVMQCRIYIVKPQTKKETKQ